VRASDDLLRQQADAALARLAGLRERVLPSDDGLVPEVLEELSVALHELQVTADELHDQNEALAAAEMRVASERTRYRRLFDFSPDGYFVTDAHGIIRWKAVGGITDEVIREQIEPQLAKLAATP